MTFRKIASLLIALLLVAGVFASCGSSDTSDNTENTSSYGTLPGSSTEKNVPGQNTPLDPPEIPEETSPETSLPETSVVETTPPETTPPETTAPEVNRPETTEKAPSEKAQKVVDTAYSLIGAPYKWGGAGPDSFDNSGFVYYVYKENGITVHRLAEGMATDGTTLTRAEMLPGDLCVMCNDIGGPAAFVGIYVGDGKFIACNNPEVPTKVQNLDSNYWTPRFISGRRVTG